jgi:pimeloyl-ACP methyl ester carboxylesterase
VFEYWEGGDPDGRPMIFHPGTPVTRLLGHWGHAAAVAAGVRLVSVNRPGYGGSTSSMEAPSLMGVGRDTAALAEHLGMDAYSVFGSSGGGPFAVATAVAAPLWDR